MNRSYQQMSDNPYQNPGPYYYPGNPSQAPARMPVVDYHYNPDLTYPQAPTAPVSWPLYPRPAATSNEELVSPLANNVKFQYPAQGASMPMQSAAFQYSAVPYMVQSMTPGMQVPRTSDNANGGKSDSRPEHRPEGSPQHNVSQIPQRTGTALMANLPKATKMQLLNPGGLQNPSRNNDDDAGSDDSSRRTSQGSAKSHKVTKPGSTSSTESQSNACDVCGKMFQKPYNLKSHMKTHSTDRPFKCSFCPKTFARSHDRKRHENLHGGQKNFKCEGYLRNGITKWGCGKKFARSDALSRHFRTETGYLCIKQFMDEEKDREGNADVRHDMPYAHPQANLALNAHPYYPQPQQQPLHQQPQHPHHPQQQHYQMNPAMRAYDPMSYAPPQISLPPLLRH